MIKPRKYRNTRSYACPKCSYGLVESRQTVDYFCPECGLTYPRAACPPKWSIEIGPRLQMHAFVITLVACLAPSHIVRAVTSPRVVTRPLRVLLIPLSVLLVLHGLAILGGNGSALWPYDLTLGQRHGALGTWLLLMVLTMLSLNTCIAALISVGLAGGGHALIAWRLWAYSVPCIAFSIGLWVLVAVALGLLVGPASGRANTDALGFLAILASPITMSVFLVLVSALWWVGMVGAMAASDQP